MSSLLVRGPARLSEGPVPHVCTRLPTRAPRSNRLQLRAEAAPPSLKRPELKRPEAPRAPTPPKPTEAPSSSSSQASSAPAVTVRFQRQQAKAMQEYFRSQSAAKTAEKAKVFGWTQKNEVGNGRWVMFGILVGGLTEYSTGVNFIDQLRMMVSFLGIADIY